MQKEKRNIALERSSNATIFPSRKLQNASISHITIYIPQDAHIDLFELEDVRWNEEE